LDTSWKLARDQVFVMASFHWAQDSRAGRLSLYFGAGTLLILGLLGTVLFMVFERQIRLHDSHELAS
tara:strand:- start:608 stop:808 length:201 start_codon:yes stop_codon:yes gene_type:complete